MIAPRNDENTHINGLPTGLFDYFVMTSKTLVSHFKKGNFVICVILGLSRNPGDVYLPSSRQADPQHPIRRCLSSHVWTTDAGDVFHLRTAGLQ